MKLDKLERVEDAQKETELSESEERRGSLKLIKNDLLARIAAMWANKENEPIVRSDFKMRVRPSNTSVESSEIFLFSSVGDYFEEEAEKLLQGIGRQFPERNLIMEFQLYPYENGSKKLRPDAVFMSVVPGSAKNQVATEMAPVSVTISAPPAAETPVAPVSVRNSTLDQLKEMLRESAALLVVTADGSGDDIAEKPIDQAFADWNLYSNAQVLRRIRRALEANGINTPRELAARLGTGSPTIKEWKDFVRTIDTPIAPNWIGESGSRDLLSWMRRIGLVQKDFREE